MCFEYKKVLVFGSGKSGIAASRLLLKNDIDVVLYDGNESIDKDKLKKDILLNLDEKDVEIVLGEFPEELLKNIDLTVMSPGVPTDLPVVLAMKEKNIPVWGEIELAYVLGKGDVLAITGTNGKTTTTALLGEIMRNYQESVFVVGNIGNPYTSIADKTLDKSVIVAEMSSFQLETIHTFHPKITAILNFSPDHLNRHHTMDAYVEAKKKIAVNQTEVDTCVLNYEDELTREFGNTTSATPFYFSSKRVLEKGIYLKDDSLYINMGDGEILLSSVDDLKLLGVHNFENIMAASAMAACYGVPVDIIRTSIQEFAGVEHRIEFVVEKNGVVYYNDSKGTNPDAAIKGIQAMNRPTLLIGGGYDKDSEYDEWINAFDGKVKKLVLVGATREKIAETAHRLGFMNTVLADTFEEAVKICVDNATKGDAVLLSPACASWGMFKNYEERGDRFKELVNNI